DYYCHVYDTTTNVLF
nr:immunoglobulin light chain junction region [Macaca mulatta]